MAVFQCQFTLGSNSFTLSYRNFTSYLARPGQHFTISLWHKRIFYIFTQRKYICLKNQSIRRLLDCCCCCCFCCHGNDDYGDNVESWSATAWITKKKCRAPWKINEIWSYLLHKKHPCAFFWNLTILKERAQRQFSVYWLLSANGVTTLLWYRCAAVIALEKVTQMCHWGITWLLHQWHTNSGI
jgi:hypothetical protein